MENKIELLPENWFDELTKEEKMCLLEEFGIQFDDENEECNNQNLNEIMKKIIVKMEKIKYDENDDE